MPQIEVSDDVHRSLLILQRPEDDRLEDVLRRHLNYDPDDLVDRVGSELPDSAESEDPEQVIDGLDE